MKKDGKVNWFTTPGLKLGIGQHDDLKTKVTALNKGSHILQAELGGKKITLTITAELAEIKRWCITDKDFDFKSDAGWGEELYALVETSALLAGEKIHLHLLEFDSSSDANYIKDLGEVSFDAKGIAKVKFTTDGIKQELNKLWNERGNYEMFFAAEVKQGAVQFAEVTRKNRGGKDTVYPSKVVSHSEHEKAKFTYIDSKKDITSVRFLKPNGKDAYEIIKYGEKITLKVQTRNLEGTELNLKNILKNNLGSGIKEYPQNVKKKVENEKAEWTLNTGAWRDWAKNKSGVALYQVEIVEADGDKVKYPNEKARLIDGKLDWTKLITYKTLKLSDTTTLDQLAKTNAPLIIGEPLEVAQASTGTCVCKDYDLIWGSKVSCEFRKKVVEIAKELWSTDYMNMANNLMACMAWETGESFSPSAKNPKSSATGLIQFMRSTAIDLGTTVEALAKMTAIEQLEYVKKYFNPIKNKKLEFVDLYLYILFPASMGKPDDHVVFSKDGTGLDKNDKNYQLRINAYSVNAGFDTNPKYGNNDGMVTKLEIKKGIQKYIDKGNENKAKTFSCIATQSTLIGSCNKCNKEHYDVAKPEHWVHQEPSECWAASIKILGNYGLKNNSGYPQNRIIMADQTGKTLTPKDTQKAFDYLDSQLKLGNPVLVGLDDNLRQATYNSHKATEHFFVIVGSGCEDGKRFYRFFDVGSPTKDQGTAEKNKLYLLDNNLLQGKSYGGSHTYTVTEVRRNN